jgi:uncharacterized protein
MTYDSATHCVAFVGDTLLAFGRLDEVARDAKQAYDANTSISPLVFHATTSARIDLDLGGNVAEVLGRLPLAAATPIRGPGRPKLGVTPREVTLLPRHWEWLSAQPGGASVALRKLVEAARKSGSAAGELRLGQEAVYKFMSSICGDYVGYEEVTRALFAGNKSKFVSLVADWPVDIQTHLARLSQAAFRIEELNA